MYHVEVIVAIGFNTKGPIYKQLVWYLSYSVNLNICLCVASGQYYVNHQLIKFTIIDPVTFAIVNINQSNCPDIVV